MNECTDIIQTHLQKFLVMVCRLTATLVLLLCLINFKQSFNESIFFFKCYAFALL